MSRLSSPLDLTATLRQVRDHLVAAEFPDMRTSRSSRPGGAREEGHSAVTFARLRRMATMGSELLMGEDVDRCETRFPCLTDDVR